MDALLLWWCFWSLIAFISAFFTSGGSPRRFAFMLILFEFMVSCIYYTLFMHTMLQAFAAR